eukprot:TRINITY_DN2922_c0_g1_i1.p1 TRINITY_DN2922_c0_g1~~TRINITY_DN2922_c0_g1_i1.p1  ORF type:complete len:138 (-),score=13.58 TRINITY_DN2922_c0_g1_i1:200-613(-)
MTSLNGACLCGKIKYTIKKAPEISIVCCCTDCQRQSASAYSTNLKIPASDFEITQGTVKGYAHKADSGNTLTSNFCGDCGSPIYNKNEADKDNVVVKMGTLEHPNAIKPGVWIYTSSLPKWIEVPKDVKNFPKMPPQ